LFADQPGLIAQTPPGQLPTSFRIDLVDDPKRERLATELQALDGVDEVKDLVVDEEFDRLRELICARIDDLPSSVVVEVFMDVDATGSQRAAVRSALRRSPDVGSFEFVSSRDAYREFRRLFADQPDLIEGVPGQVREQLPSSFRVEMDDGRKPARLVREMEELPGVDDAAFVSQVAAQANC